MKFDIAIMNPPFRRNLHLRIVEKVIPNCKETINISPIRWMLDPLAKYKKNSDYNKFRRSVAEHTKSLKVISKAEAENIFDIVNSGMMGIAVFDNYNYCFENKSLSMKCFEKIKDNLCEIECNKKDGWRVRVSIISNNNHRHSNSLNNIGKLLVFKDGMKDGKKWYTFFQKNKWSRMTDEITYSIKFESEKEAQNFIDSLNTIFGKWYENEIVNGMNISKERILWMGDYTQPWTDERFRDYFNITDEEWSSIEETIEKYN